MVKNWQRLYNLGVVKYEDIPYPYKKYIEKENEPI